MVSGTGRKIGVWQILIGLYKTFNEHFYTKIKHNLKKYNESKEE